MVSSPLRGLSSYIMRVPWRFKKMFKGLGQAGKKYNPATRKMFCAKLHQQDKMH
jgi:hypothetical protein